MKRVRAERSVVLAAVLTLALLLALGWLQYRWLSDVAAAQTHSLRRQLEVAAERIARDFDLEISRAFFPFLVRDRPGGRDRPDHLLRGLAFFRATALEPDLVSDLYLLARGAPVRRLAEERRELVEAPLPGRLRVDLPRILNEVRSRRAGDASAEQMPVLEDPPTIIVPPRIPRGLQRLARDPEGAAADPPDGESVEDLVLVTLDPRVLRERFLPDLVSTHLGDSAGDFVVAVFGSEPGAPPIFSSGSADRRRDDAWEVTRPIWIVHPFPELRLARAARRGGATPSGSEPETDVEIDPAYALRADRGSAGPWLLAMGRADGPLEAAVARTRALNLLLSFGTLVLLAATTVLLLRAVRQGALLARRQMDFVAGVTHELHTPLAAISAAADNLADGIASDDRQVRRYGEVIRGEGKRLASRIGQVLDFAGIGRAPEPIHARFDVVESVREILAERTWELETSGIEVEVSEARDLPAAWGDRGALGRALGNLVDNAIKYGARGGWLGIGVDLDPEGRLRVRVSDRGPGVARGDDRRIFEAFRRGRATAVGHAHGSGLGLAVAKELVESFGGELGLESTGGPGATFTVLVPAVDGESEG